MSDDRAAPSTRRRVWSLTVRLTHWSLAALVLIDFIDDSGGKFHRYVGYAAVIVILIRLMHGLASQVDSARLPWPRPAEFRAHVREMLSGRTARVARHNPVGAAMVLLLWTLVLLLSLSGWIMRWDMFWGEDWPGVIHAWLADALLVCVILHIAGVALSSFLERQNLVRGMVTGEKYIDSD